jgi:hypothetical protein
MRSQSLPRPMKFWEVLMIGKSFIYVKLVQGVKRNRKTYISYELGIIIRFDW